MSRRSGAGRRLSEPSEQMKRTVRSRCTPSSALGVPSGLKQGRPLARWGRRKKAQPAVRSACVRHVCGTGWPHKPACSPLPREAPPWLRRMQSLALAECTGCITRMALAGRASLCHARLFAVSEAGPDAPRLNQTSLVAGGCPLHPRGSRGIAMPRSPQPHPAYDSGVAASEQTDVAVAATTAGRALDSQHRGSFLLCPRAAGRHPARKSTRRS